jgi:hypothetical protein
MRTARSDHRGVQVYKFNVCPSVLVHSCECNPQQKLESLRAHRAGNMRAIGCRDYDDDDDDDGFIFPV